MQENTKQKRTFGEWIEDHSTQILAGACICAVSVMAGGYLVYLHRLDKVYESEMAALTAIAEKRINELGCEQCVKAVVTELTGE